jgi:DNA-binding NarL/FixJ family response regulator
MIRILIADDHKPLRRALRGTLEEYDAWEVCGEASDGAEAVSLALKLKPDIAVLDFAMPRLNGIEATRRIKNALPQIEVLIFTMYDSEEIIRSACEAGARGFVLKTSDHFELVKVIQAITRQESSSGTGSHQLGNSFFRPSGKEV